MPQIANDRRRDLEAVARDIVDSNAYMTLATADETGLPWVSPVWYASEGYEEFFWVSSPEARHSRNVAARPEVAVVFFDSTAPVGAGQAVYVSAVAKELTGADLDRGVEIYSGESVAGGLAAWGLEEVRPPAPYRLYRARATDHWVLDPEVSPNRRVPVNP